MEGLEEIKKLLEESNQSHILKYWDELNEDQQRDFLQQLKGIDFKRALQMYELAHETFRSKSKLTESDMQPIKVEIQEDYEASEIEEYRSIGLEEIANGKVAVIVLAGGQGTRLGLPYPKGMCPTGIPSGKTLFQLQAERMQRLMRLALFKTGKKGPIHWYLMTSEATHTLIDRFLQQNRFFGLNKENVRLFKQAQIPCFDLEGKILLEEKDGVAMSPDGNGGIYKALKESGVLDEMDQKGIKYVHVHSVDNILIRVADPVFVGKCVKDHVDCGLKVVKKTDPKEPLGVVCKADSNISVVEYSEIEVSVAQLKMGDTEDLLYNAGNICNHFFTVDFLKEMAYEHEDGLRLHLAKKTATHVGPEGDKIFPTDKNCEKIEKFIFDAIPYSKSFLAWQVDRREEFSPIKNSDVSKTDCFPTARRDLLALHKTWVELNGGVVKGAGLEVSPLLSYAGEGLHRIKGRDFREGEVLWSEDEEKQQEKWG